MSLNATYRDIFKLSVLTIILNRIHMFTKVISNLLIWMCIREIIFIKRENRTLVSNAFLNLMCMKFEFDIP